MSSSSTDRTFGFTMAIAFAVLALLRMWRRGFDQLAILLTVVAVLFAILALMAPRSLAPINRAWMRFAEILGWINTRILLIVIFYLFVTPFGIVMRLLGRNPLDFEKRDSYWTEPPKNSYGDRHFENQF